MTYFITILLFFSAEITATPMENLQLQKLIEKSEVEIQTLKKILSSSKKNEEAMAQARNILKRMNSDIDKSIKSYKGTAVYEQALLRSQSENNFKNTYYDSHNLKQRVLANKQADQEFVNIEIEKFQKDSVKANQNDIKNQEKLHKALQSAGSGLIPKIQAHTQLGIWRSNIRLSSQITEMIAVNNALREELRLIRMKNNYPNVLDLIVKGADMQNKKHKEVTTDEFN